MSKRAIVVWLATLMPTGALAQSVVATWEAVTQDINGQPESLRGYHVAWGTARGGPYPNGQSTGVVTQLRIDNLQNGQRYYFVVKAIDLAGNESAWSNEAEYLVPEEDCQNGIDDDHDGLTDCQDTECGGCGDGGFQDGGDGGVQDAGDGGGGISIEGGCSCSTVPPSAVAGLLAVLALLALSRRRK